MGIPYELWIALRYLRARRREVFISLITWISVGGVAVGVMALIVVLSVMTGFEEDLREKILGTNAHVLVRSQQGTLSDPEALVREIETLPRVVAAAPVINSQVMLMAGGRVQGAVFRGVSPEGGAQVTELERFVVMGSLSALHGEVPGLLVGREMARNMGLLVGDTIQVVDPVGTPTPLGIVPRMRAFRVAGVFASGMYEYDTGYVFTELGYAQDFLRFGGTVTGVEIKVDDIFGAAEVGRQLSERLGDGYRVQDWMQRNRSLFGALKLEKTAMFLTLALIVLVAAFNIASTLVMVVLDKARDIGVLKSMGATRRAIRRIFVFEGLVIGTVGTVAGIASGWVLCLLLRRYQFIELPRDVYYITTLPVVMNPLLYGVIGAAAVVLCLLATVYPAWQASRLDPVETIRYE